MYSLGAYGSMIKDPIRAGSYAEALRRTVRKGSVVVDIGTGPGVFAVLACQLGASRVFAIEPAEIIQVAREVATVNGCADKIEFYEEASSRVTLPVRADVIVSDLRGVLPLYQRHIPDIADARRRFCLPEGKMIPRRDTLWAAIIEAPKPYGETVDPWDQNSFGQDLSPARQLAVNDVQKVYVGPGQLLSGHKLWTTLDYTGVEDPDFCGNLEWDVKRAGTGHGFIVWFDTDLAEGVGFSNAPWAPETVYGSLLFPWTQPAPLVAGQTVCVELAAKLVEDDYLWRWSTRIQPVEGSSAFPSHFEQSQFDGAVLSGKKLRRSAADYIPQLSEGGLVRRRTLELMDGSASLEEIARVLVTEFPKRFSNWHQALSYAGRISQEFSR